MKYYLGHCYMYINQSQSWFTHRNYCKSQGADLMEIDNQDEYKLLYNYYTSVVTNKSRPIIFVCLLLLWLFLKIKLICNLKIGGFATVVKKFFWNDGRPVPSNTPTTKWWCEGRISV